VRGIVESASPSASKPFLLEKPAKAKRSSRRSSTPRERAGGAQSARDDAPQGVLDIAACPAAR